MFEIVTPSNFKEVNFSFRAVFKLANVTLLSPPEVLSLAVKAIFPPAIVASLNSIASSLVAEVTVARAFIDSSSFDNSTFVFCTSSVPPLDGLEGLVGVVSVVPSVVGSLTGLVVLLLQLTANTAERAATKNSVKIFFVHITNSFIEIYNKHYF